MKKKIVKRNKMWTEKLNKACQGTGSMVEVGRLITILDSGFNCFAPNYSNYEWLPNAVAKADEQVIEAIKSDEQEIVKMNRWLSAHQQFYGELSDRVYVAEAIRYRYNYRTNGNQTDLKKLWSDTFSSEQPDIPEDTPHIIKTELMHIKYSSVWHSPSGKANFIRSGSHAPKNYNLPDITLRRVINDFERYGRGEYEGSLSHMMTSLKNAITGVKQVKSLFKVMDRMLRSVSSHEKIYITSRKKWNNDEAYVYIIDDPNTQRLPKHYRRYNLSERRDAFGSDWGGLWLQDMDKLLSKAQILVTKYTMDAEIVRLQNQQASIEHNLQSQKSMLKTYNIDYEANTSDEANELREMIDSFNSKILKADSRNTPFKYNNVIVVGNILLKGSQGLDNLKASIVYAQDRIEKLNGELHTVQEQLTAYGVISEEE